MLSLTDPVVSLCRQSRWWQLLEQGFNFDEAHASRQQQVKVIGCMANKYGIHARTCINQKDSRLLALMRWVLIIPNLWCHNLRDESRFSTFQLFLMFTIVLGCWFNIQLGKTQENGSFLWDLFVLYAPISVFIRFPQRPASFPAQAILVKRRASFNIINLKISSSIMIPSMTPREYHYIKASSSLCYTPII